MVVLVVAAIVITILVLATRIARQARTAVAGTRSRSVRTQTARACRASRASTTRACGSCTRRARCGRWRSENDLPARSIRHDAVDRGAGDRPRRGAGSSRPCSAIRSSAPSTDIDHSADALLAVAGDVAGSTANIPQLEATAPVLALIVDEAVVQDGYMNALTDGYGLRHGPTTHWLVLLSVLLAVVVVAVVAVALILVRRGLESISGSCATLASALTTRRGRAPATASSPPSRRSTRSSTPSSAPFPGSPTKAAIVAERRPR